MPHKHERELTFTTAEGQRTKISCLAPLYWICSVWCVLQAVLMWNGG